MLLWAWSFSEGNGVWLRDGKGVGEGGLEVGSTKGLYTLGIRLRTGQSKLESSGFVGGDELDGSGEQEVRSILDVDVLFPTGGGGDEACISPLQFEGLKECRSQG